VLNSNITIKIVSYCLPDTSRDGSREMREIVPSFQGGSPRKPPLEATPLSPIGGGAGGGEHRPPVRRLGGTMHFGPPTLTPVDRNKA